MDTTLFACADDARAIIRERALDFAERMCSKGYPHLTERRKARLWGEVREFLEYCLDQGATGWEENELEGDYPCDLFHDHFEHFDMSDRDYHRGKEYRFIRMLSAVCRSAFDAVSGFPGGVWGFTVGDLRRMYNGQIPTWIDDGWVDRDKNPVSLNSATDETTLFI